MVDFKKYLLGTTIVMGLAAVGAPVWAQSQPQSETADAASAESDPGVIDDIVVVGSRLRRDTFNSPSPIQVVTREEATLAGFASVTDVLQSTAVTQGTSQINNAYGGYVTDGGPGANTLSLRGLGATRTLVLLNGRRVAPAGSRGSVGSADLNVLPTAMIERVEILKDGASSLYGSDAVAGVVNIVTRNDLDGVTVEGQYNAPLDASGAGDQTRLSIVAGTHGDRWSLSGSAEYYNREELTLGDREFARCPIDNYIDGTDYIDPMTGRSKCWSLNAGGVTVNTIGTSNIAGVAADGAVGTVFNRWRPNTAVTTGLTGFEGVGNTATNTNVRDTFDPDMLNQSLISPVEVATLYLQGSYDLQALGNAEVYGEFLYNQRKSSQTGYRQLALDYAVGSPLIPANLAGSVFSPGDLGLNLGQAVGVRAFIGYGNDTSSQTVDFTKSVAGIRGDFLPLDGWHYDVSASYTKSDSTYSSPQFLIDRLQNSLDVVSNGAGGFSCANLAAGCVAAPAINNQTLAGDLPADWLNYVMADVVGTTVYDEAVLSASIDGDLFTMPAGVVRGFVGAEYREMSIDDTPGIDMQTSNVYNYSSSAVTRGDDSVWEVFGEVEVPLLRDQPFAENLTLSASGRYTNYDSYGDDTTYKLGLVYTPVDFVTFRGSYGTSYRAPALFEQFVGATTGFLGTSFDPCNNYGDAGADPIVAANCASQGLAPDFQQTSGVTVVTKGGADAGLEAETSTNLTVGMVLQPTLPDAWGELAFAVDYYEIEVENGVDRLGASGVLDRCYSSASADFAAGNGYCALVDRDGTSNALTVDDSYLNLATDVVHGIDYTLRYRKPVGPGTALINLGVTQMLERHSTLSADDPVYDEVGTIGTPEFTATADVSYAWDQWRVHYGVEWISATGYDDYYLKNYGYTLAELGYDAEVGSYATQNVSVRYEADDWAVTAGIRNLTNETGGLVSAGVVDMVGNVPLYSGYDYVGRTAFINLSKSF
ncbi:TonB-dependent receptor plug domain-containing protein [Brevundimonas lenta]|uniref:Outer membrane receptor protein involved in Fe transport n=1 Tax=Brevundimonas lenta TaxID=424796 RepID=A0A7W6NQH1_9CAUL|nr:TonB-dependent receptor [Brevundimonas lenta]MBB4083165.1 outer membrane receptor protein involved in Fe transport [Brevundimonas lenta]